MEANGFHKLFEPFKLGKLKLRNRLVMTSMSTGFAGTGGRVSDQLIEYYATRAAGGVGMVTVEMIDLHPQLYHVRNALTLCGDHQISGLRRLTDRIHSEGAAASVQIGVYFRQELNGFPRYSTNEVSPEGAKCLALNKNEIKYLVSMIAKGAERVRASGFDAVEIHACHGCLVSEFLSPYWNKRTDEYGGSSENRFRFAVEIMRETRERVGADFPVLFRISGDEFAAEGFTQEDAVGLSVALEEAGITGVSLSGGLGHLDHIGIPPGHIPRGILLPSGEAIKKAVRVPVIVGNSMTPELAVKALENGQADLIGLGRPLIADPEWPKKVQNGDVGVVRKCIRCNQGCFGGLRNVRLGRINCTYNPSVGREGESDLREAEEKKRVVVVGGGPAGCETARVCAARGHKVILLEQDDALGGQFRLAAMAPGKSDFSLFADFYQNELPRLGVDVRLNTTATDDILSSLDADIFVLAAGSKPSLPRLEGIDQAHVLTAHDFLKGKVRIEEGPVVVVGGGATGLEVSHLLAAANIEVSVVELLDAPGRDMVEHVGPKEHLLDELEDKGVEVFTSRRAVKILKDALIVSDRPLIGGETETSIPARWVIFSAGMTPQRSLLNEKTLELGEWRTIGDCESPGNGYQAIHEAYRRALGI